jgi:DNA-3-methyladenine glycosylase I
MTSSNQPKATLRTPQAPSSAKRCSWATTPEMIAYHDTEWGTPVHDDRVLFEFLILEGAQAGLSWATILRKRERYRKVFYNFDPQRVARITPARMERILEDPGIIRNRAKVTATIANARAFLAIQKEFGSFDRYVWAFVKSKTIDHRPRTPADVPPTGPESAKLSEDLRERGFNFVGPTIMYAFMQAVGMVNDHLRECSVRKTVRP